MENDKKLNVSVKSFITAIAVIAVLSCLTYALTFVIEAGEYSRIIDEQGNMVIDPTGGFDYVKGGLSVWKWLLSPILVLGADGSGTLIAVIVFLLVIGGVFTCLEDCGIMSYMLAYIVDKFGNARYKLMYILTFFFMAMGAFIGSFEECVPLVPIVVSLSISLGWDSLTGLGMSLLAVGCGFASGVFNPFTVGIAQTIAGLSMFSGVSMRLLSFVLIYILLMFFLVKHAKKIETNTEANKSEFVQDNKSSKALKRFVFILGMGIAIVLLSGVIPSLQDLTMVVVALAFLLAGIIAVLTAGMPIKKLLKVFGKGIVTMLPAVLLILMASSIKYILTESKILDTLLYYAVEAASGMPKWGVILFIYGIVLIMNFFISSGSAKAFLLMPLIVPMAQIFGIPTQLTVLAFAFGDGFSNVFYPTNAALLIALSLAGVSYGKWVKYSWKFQAANLALTSILLLFGLVIGYC